MESSASHWRWKASAGERKGARIELVRRGVRHGFVERVSKPPTSPEGLERCFSAGEPILLRGWLALDSVRAKARIEATRLWFERLRREESFSEGLRARLTRYRGAKPAVKFCGTSVDVGDPREIEKAHIELGGLGRAGKQLYAKLSWIAEDERDHSLRVRFSFGNERSDAWRSDVRSSLASDRLAELAFPECELLARHRALLALLERLHDARVRLSERIVYSNAPGGGASFHHDAEPRQLAVVYGQMYGSTGWLALPRSALAQELAALAATGPLARRAGTPKKADAALENTALAPLDALLNHDRRLTKRLVERGAFYRLEAGDVLVLPSPSPAVCAWHSVFALGARPSVAHSYGLFALPAGLSR